MHALLSCEFCVEVRCLLAFRVESGDSSASWFLRRRMVLETASVVVEHDGNCILNRVSLNVRRGEVLGVVGRNGAGKSALLALLSGMLGPKRGRVLLRGEEQTKEQSLLRQSVVLYRHGSSSHSRLSFEAWLEYCAFAGGIDLDLIKPRLGEYREWVPAPTQQWMRSHGGNAVVLNWRLPFAVERQCIASTR